MKKKFRLKKNEQIREIIKSKLFLSNKTYKVVIQKNTLNHLRVCISVSKKIGNAVTRNKIRRQVRAMINIYNNYQKTFDIVIIIKYDYLNNIYLKNQKILFTALDKLLLEGESKKWINT